MTIKRSCKGVHAEENMLKKSTLKYKKRVGLSWLHIFILMQINAWITGEP
jgi:hypothetical protein